MLTVDGERLNALSVDDLQYFETRFFLVPGTGTVYVDSKLSVIRQRAGRRRLPRGADDPQPRRRSRSTSTVRIDAGSDFADLFEVKDALEKKGTYSTPRRGRQLVLGYERETFSARRRSRRPPRASSTRAGSRFDVRIEPHGEWTTDLDVVTEPAAAGRTRAEVRASAARRAPRPNMEREPREVDRRTRRGSSATGSR